MNSIELDTNAEIVNLVNQIIRITIADAQRRINCGSAMPTLDRSAQRLGERLDQGYRFTVVVENKSNA